MLLTVRDTLFDFTSRCHYMGIVNVTPDSFSDGGRHETAAPAFRHALALVEEGADIIDIGGESTRPGAAAVSVAEQLRRVIPVVTMLRAESGVPISIDTRSADVAEAAIAAGADCINDVSALRHDARMASVAAKAGVPVVLMHMQGTPETMQTDPRYDNVVKDVRGFFEERIAAAHAAGIRQVILDPGIGFGKRLEDNLALIRHLAAFHSFGLPLLVGTSRKAFIGALTDSTVDDRLAGTIASCVIAVRNGASMLRVHDVGQVRKAILVSEALEAGEDRA